jgi:uncharacterized membrane protein YedE/YeeE
MKTRSLVLFAAGGLFGAGLALSGMTDPGRVVGFLDVTGTWDPSLAFVMGGALAVFGVGAAAWRRRNGTAGLYGSNVPTRSSEPVDARLIIGALIFGVGWGVSGFCPGPAIANLAAVRTDALVFVPAMAVGAILARIGFGADQD